MYFKLFIVISFKSNINRFFYIADNFVGVIFKHFIWHNQSFFTMVFSTMNLLSRFQTLHWDNHSFFMMVSSRILIIIKFWFFKLKAYWFVNDLLCALSCLSSSVGKVTSTVSFILLIQSLELFSNTSLGITISFFAWFPVTIVVKQNRFECTWWISFTLVSHESGWLVVWQAGWLCSRLAGCFVGRLVV